MCNGFSFRTPFVFTPGQSRYLNRSQRWKGCVDTVQKVSAQYVLTSFSGLISDLHASLMEVKEKLRLAIPAMNRLQRATGLRMLGDSETFR